jgi:hypothetical protein
MTCTILKLVAAGWLLTFLGLLLFTLWTVYRDQRELDDLEREIARWEKPR